MDRNDFTLLATRELKEVDGTVSLWQHKVTHAEVLSISNKDENKCFGVSFRTPPANSTGVAHIMEHSVLCGSEKYPVKEPFVELLKGSLQTFLNAFTFPDKTCYPVASANLQDFYNLIDVYLDAVFHPRITEDIFKQEGWHLEAPSVDGEWSYKGVVYNEMKGSYSSPESVLAEQSQQALFPDMLYHYDSGGDPDTIPELTYEDFRAFHAAYYHPSNARFFFWGDDPEEERFKIVAKALEGYTYRAIDSQIPLQAPFTTPRLREVAYAAASPEQKCMFSVSWLLAERGNVKEALLMEMLEQMLEGLPGSPLRRALISSGLGEDLAGQGLETDLRQMYYSIGLKGIAQVDVTKAETLIFDTLENLASKGFDPKEVEAAVNTVEFAYRERNSGRLPQGLVAMIQALSTWLYDGDPFSVLAWEEPLAEIKARLQQGEPLFENLLRSRFLNNTHRSTVILVPDLKLGSKREEAEAKRVACAKAALSSAEQAAYVEATKHLQAAQLAPDAPEDLAKIPALQVSDLPKENKIIAEDVVNGKLTTLAHPQPTLGIAYTQLLIPLANLPQRLIPLLPILLRALTEMGTAKHDYVTFGLEMAGKTGGVYAALCVGHQLITQKPFTYFTLGGKAVYAKVPELFALFHEILFQPIKDQEVALKRLGEMLFETRARLEQGMQSAGHAVISCRLAARYNLAGTYSELTSGVSYLEAIRNYIEILGRDPLSILQDLETLRSYLLNNQDVLFSCTAEDEAIPELLTAAQNLYAELPHAADSKEPVVPILKLPAKEALLIPSRINFVGKSTNLYANNWQYHGSASVILRYLRMGYLWEHVRVRGGAYGAFCNLNRASGTLICASFRDPNHQETLQAYDQMAAYLGKFTPDKAQLTQAIVGAVGDLDSYELPSARGAVALNRYLTNDTPEMRQQMREEMLGTTAKDFRNFADVLASLAQGQVCILGGQEVEAFAKAQGYAIKQMF
ncbi:MAG: insulinase family protein [Desulfovibrionaceae bacterium]|nr:insulinase family protein [Desulfovibrionaceae bacterium]